MMMTVNEVSKLAGVSIRTLQYYDKIGLLHPTGYTDAGYRLYDDADLERLQHILLFRELDVYKRQNIDFTGYADGEKFEVGSGNSYPREIGSGTFIPGFEEQLVGASVGDEIDVNVTFPEDYGAPALAGKDALFKVKVNKIEEVHIPVLDDNVRKDLREKLEEQKATQNEIELEGALIGAVVADSDVEVPEDEIIAETASLVNEWKLAMRQRGICLLYTSVRRCPMPVFIIL